MSSAPLSVSRAKVQFHGMKADSNILKRDLVGGREIVLDNQLVMRQSHT